MSNRIIQRSDPDAGIQNNYAVIGFAIFPILVLLVATALKVGGIPTIDDIVRMLGEAATYLAS